MPNWKDRYREIKDSSSDISDDSFVAGSYTTNREPALIGYNSLDSDDLAPSVVCRDNGCIELFSGPKLGIRIDPRHNTVSIFGSRICLVSDSIDFKTSILPSEGMRWNKKPMNLTPSLGVETGVAGTPLPGTISLLSTEVKDTLKYVNNLRKLR